MYDVIIIDSNNWYHRNFETHKDMTHKVGEKTIVTGGIYGFLQSVKKWRRNFSHSDTKFYFLFDNPTTKSNLRQQMIDPHYKENRKKRPKSFYRSIDYLRLILENYDNDFYCIYGTGYESDDIAPYVLKKIPQDKKVLLISEDMDWSRLISENVHQYMKDRIFTKKEFQNKYGFIPTLNSIVLYKTIRGDKVDDIPIGLSNLPEKILLKLIDNYKDIYDILDNLKTIRFLSELWQKRFIENRDRLILNHQLVSFFKIQESYLNECTSKGKYKPEQLKILYESLGFDIYDFDKRVYIYLQEKKMKKKYGDSFLLPPEALIKR